MNVFQLLDHRIIGSSLWTKIVSERQSVGRFETFLVILDDEIVDLPFIRIAPLVPRIFQEAEVASDGFFGKLPVSEIDDPPQYTLTVRHHQPPLLLYFFLRLPPGPPPKPATISSD